MTEFSNPQQREERAIELLSDIGSVLEGHFVYANGDHGNAYVAKDEALKRPEAFSELTFMMAQNVADAVDPDEVDVLVAAAPCGSLIASRMAEHLGMIWQVTPPRLAFAEKQARIVDGPDGPSIEEKLVFKRGFRDDLVGKNVLEVEDIVNSGKTVRELSELVLSIAGVKIVGLSALYNRTPSMVTGESLAMDLWLPLVERELSKSGPQDCEQCTDLDAYPINTDRGHGEKFITDLAVLASAQQ